MSNLVPEVRVNKNGVPVTKHVRSHSPTTDKRGIPAVGASTLSKDDKSQQAMNIVRASDGVAGGILRNQLTKSKMGTNVYKNLMATLHPETLERIESKIQEVPRSMVQSAAADSIKERNFSLLNNMGVLMDHCGGDPNHLSYYIAGLNAHFREPSEYRDYGDATEEELEAPRAVLRAATTLSSLFVSTDYFSKATTRHVSSPYLVELIEERPEDVDRIVAFLNDRRTNVNQEDGMRELISFLDSDSPQSLQKGLL